MAGGRSPPSLPLYKPSTHPLPIWRSNNVWRVPPATEPHFFLASDSAKLNSIRPPVSNLGFIILVISEVIVKQVLWTVVLPFLALYIVNLKNIFFRPQGYVLISARYKDILHNNYASYHCVRCRIRTRNPCPRSHHIYVYSDIVKISLQPDNL